MKIQLSCFALLVSFGTQAAFAQTSSTTQGHAAQPHAAQPHVVQHKPVAPGQTWPPRQAGTTYKRDANQFKFEVLNKAPDLPDMPPYPSTAKFLDSSVSPNPSAGPAFHVMFTSPDEPMQVMQYYETMLPSLQWKIQRKTSAQIYAIKGTSVVTIFVQRPSRPKMKCDFWVLYSTGKTGRQS